MARSPNCCSHIFFSLFTAISLVACLLALMTPAWLIQNTAADGSTCSATNPSDFCGTLGPVVACDIKADSPIGGTCLRWDQRANLNILDPDSISAAFEAFPIVYWRAATGCYAAAIVLIGFTFLFSLWNWTCCTKTERAAGATLFISELLILAAVLLYFGGLGQLNDPEVTAVVNCNVPGVTTEFAAFAANPGNCSFGWSAGIAVGSLITTIIATCFADQAKIPDEYYA